MIGSFHHSHYHHHNQYRQYQHHHYHLWCDRRSESGGIERDEIGQRVLAVSTRASEVRLGVGVQAPPTYLLRSLE